jgi:arylsulfatase A
MNKIALLFTICLAVVGALPAVATPPHVVFILADDLGYGDVGCYNPESKIPTPHVDRLAAEGTRFTDMHSGSAVCTPSRYGIITGRYSWRSKLQSGVTHGPTQAIIDAGRPTVASFLKEQGYRTACVGKWHLGLGWQRNDGVTDFAAPVSSGPTTLGFDYFFGIPASLDMPPYLFLENDRAVEPPTETIADRVKPLYWRGGAIAPGFKHEDVHPTFTRKAVEVIERHAAEHADKPLFLYLPLASPHTPILPTAGKGRSAAGDYGDFICDVDDTVGAVRAALEKAGMLDNTLLIFTSDNGFSPPAGAERIRAMGHEPCPGLRGAKTDIFEGGHRVPFIMRWPGRVEAGKVREDVAWQGDLFATMADILGVPVPDGATDSVSFLRMVDGSPAPRGAVVHHSADGFFALREGPWKLIFASHSGGWGKPKKEEAKALGLPPLQLYNLATDLAEQHNVAEEHPDIVERMTAAMESIIANGRSTPGPAATNDARVILYKR